MTESSIIPDTITDSTFSDMPKQSQSEMTELISEKNPSTNKLSETLFTNKVTQEDTFSNEIFTHTDKTIGTEEENTFSENTLFLCLIDVLFIIFSFNFFLFFILLNLLGI